LTIHFIDYISSLVSHTLYAGNWFNLFFWLSAIFIAALIFAYSLIDVFGIYFLIIFPPLIVINFYIAQSLFILERAKYGVIAGVLIFLSLVFKFLDKRISILTASFLVALNFTFFNAGSLIGVALFGNLFIPVFVIILFYFIYGVKSKNFSYLFPFVKLLILSSFFFLIFNSYQLLPYIPSIINKSYVGHLNATVSQTKDWVDYISTNTSLLNLLRLEGVPTWYAGSNTANPEHAYASLYINNFFFVFVSFLLPMIAFLGVLLTRNIKKKKFIFLFLFIALISLPFTAGTHPPFGFIYGFLYDHLPGFFIFRNPYYKFEGSFLIGVCAAIAATLSIFVRKISKNFVVGLFISFLFVGGWLTYHYKILLPNEVFTWKSGFSTRINIPSYFWDFREWNNKENTANEKILLVPALSSRDLSDGYKWGYWSLSPLSYNLANVPGLVNEGDLTGTEKGWVDSIYKSINGGNEASLNTLSTRLGVGYLLFRKDVTNSDKVSSIENTLNSFISVKKIETFGEWELYRLKDSRPQEIFPISSLTVVPQNESSLAQEFVTDKNVVEKSDMPQNLKNSFLDEKINTYTCQSCLLERVSTYADLPAVTIFPSSPLYFLKERSELSGLKQAENDGTKILDYLAYVFRRSSEVKSMFALSVDDKYIILDLNKIDLYLDNVNGLLNKHSELKSSYSMAKQILDVTNPLLNDFHRFVVSENFGRRQDSVKSVFYTEIDRLNKLHDYFLSILQEPGILRNNKVYFLGIESGLYLDSFSLSKDTNGKLSLPIDISYQVGTSKFKLALEDGGQRWLKIGIPTTIKEAGTLNLKFELPNIFQNTGANFVSFPSGQYGCIFGKIYNFDPGKAYEINVLAKSKDQRLALYNSSFRKIVDIYPIETSLPFRYIYEPDSNSGSSLFLCTDDRDMPDIVSIAIYDMVSPNLESITNLDQVNNILPNISYTKVNKTKYLVTVKNAQRPYILDFNEKFSPYWRLQPANSSKISLENYLFSKNDTNHFPINGYANAWLVDNKDQENWVLEYTPQRFFYIGSAISVISIIIFGVVVAIYEKNKTRKN
jgi:hypothetical protein